MSEVRTLIIDADGTLRVPRGTTLPVSGMIEGDIFYKTDDDILYSYTGSTWIAITRMASHNHSVASGAGAIATDQIAKFGDGGVTNYAEVQTTGKYRGYGTGRWKCAMYTFLQSVAGTTTYNGNSYAASTGVVLGTDRASILRSFASGARQYGLVQTALPADYVAGTDVTINLACCANDSGNAMVNIGVLATNNGDSFDIAPTYGTLSAVTMTGTYQRVTKSFTVTGTIFVPGECISIVVMRNGVDGGDTLGVALLMTGVGLVYTADKIGGDV